MKKWHCNECGKWRETKDDIVMNICWACQVQMQEIKEEKKGNENA